MLDMGGNGFSDIPSEVGMSTANGEDSSRGGDAPDAPPTWSHAPTAWQNPEHCWVQNMTDPENKVPPYPKNESECIFMDLRFKDHVVNAIMNHDPTVPLFIYYAPHMVHSPLEVPKIWHDKFDFIEDPFRRTYHAMTAYIDDAVKDVVDALKTKGMWDETFMWVSS